MMGRSQTSLRIQTSQKPFSTSKLAPTTLPYHLPPPSYPGVASAAEGSPYASTSQSTMTAQVFQIRLPLRVWMTTRVEMGANNHSHSVLLHPNLMMTLSLSVREMQTDHRIVPNLDNPVYQRRSGTSKRKYLLLGTLNHRPA